MAKTSPLLAVGIFGVHLVDTSGIWFFAGTIPKTIRQGGYSSLEEGTDAFVNWFKSQDLDFQRDHIGNLRNDIFAMVMTS